MTVSLRHCASLKFKSESYYCKGTILSLDVDVKNQIRALIRTKNGFLRQMDAQKPVIISAANRLRY